MASDGGYRLAWRLRGLMNEYLVVRGVDMRANEVGRPLTAHSALWRLRGWRGDPTAERTLVDIHEALGGRMRWGLSSLERRAFLESLWTELEEAFQSGRLVLLELPRPVFATADPQEIAEAAWEDNSEPTSWVGLLLEDEDGEPVAGQRVRVKLADGTYKEGVSDDKGRIRLEGIPMGNCQVEFPGLDAGDWRVA